MASRLDSSGLSVDGDLSVTGTAKVPTPFYTCPAGQMTVMTVSGQTPTAGSIVTDADSLVTLSKIDFAAGVQQYARMTTLVLPDDYDGQALKAEWIWTGQAAGSGGVKWWIQYKVIAADGSDVTQTGSSAATVQSDEDTFQGQDVLHKTTKNFTPSGAVAGSVLSVSVRRRGAGTGADTYASAAALLAVRIGYA